MNRTRTVLVIEDDPHLDLKDFFPLLLKSIGTWDGIIYGLPFDNYSGLLFYNRCLLRKAGFDRPPGTWPELKDVYGPALTKDNRYAFALQSHCPGFPALLPTPARK